jgi:hypothetical protein
MYLTIYNGFVKMKTDKTNQQKTFPVFSKFKNFDDFCSKMNLSKSEGFEFLKKFLSEEKNENW